MNEFQLRCFMTAASCLSFTRAAQLMNLTQPALTHNISALESELGMRLFFRDKRQGTCLTPAGEALAHRLPDLQDELAAALNEAREMDSGKHGRLSLCFLDGHWIDERTRAAVRAFRQAQPGIHLRVQKRTNAEQVQGLISGKMDIVFGMQFNFDALQGVSWRKVYSVPHYMMLPMDAPVEDGGTYDLDVLRGYTMILPQSGNADTISNQYDRQAQLHGMQIQTIQVKDHRDQLALLELGFGITGTDDYSLMSAAGQFKKVRIRGIPDLVVVMAWRTEDRNPSAALFREAFFREEDA